MWEQAASGFAAMGSEARLGVLKTLIRAGRSGLSIGDIQARTGIAPSTLAHHIKILAASALITQVKQGRTVMCFANFDTLQSLAGFIQNECCIDEDREVANNG